MDKSSYKNRLATETSPYLQQHANNPVDWYPWSKEALEKAQREDKPILLSIGYSACHWCHVMAHESFEDEDTAKLMNELYVNIKVDREERPDLDKICQLAYQMLTQRGGGWPLTVFMTPDEQIPFFIGTYFPPERRYNLPAFKEILQYIAKFYHEHKSEIIVQNDSLLKAFAGLNPTEASDTQLNLSPIENAIAGIAGDFDRIYAGFGNAPKFPQTMYLELLLQHCDLKSNVDLKLMMVKQTLTQMAQGGIYDHLGGGFFRYSVDAMWNIPHFEKMLYDNALLLGLYAHAYLMTRELLYKEVIEETAEWVIKEMQSPEGGYYSALDADSEGKEGKFYEWSKEQIEKVLTPEEYCVASVHFNLQQPANFEGHWHLHILNNIDDVAKQVSMPVAIVKQLLHSAKNKLLAERNKRVSPGRDEKILTAWNALMIKAMTIAGITLDNPKYIDSAERALNFLRENNWINGRLSAVYKDGQANVSGFLDDHVFMLEAVLLLLQVRWKNSDLLFAQQLAEIILAHFYDKASGGFYFTADDHETLFYRPKNFLDEALPSGNGVAALVLNRLSYLMGEKSYWPTVDKTLQLAWPLLQRNPQVFVSLLQALNEFLHPPEIVVIRGKQADIDKWRRSLQQTYSPHRLVLAIPDDIKDLPKYLADKKPLATTVAYVCRGTECSEPITSFDKLSRLGSEDLT